MVALRAVGEEVFFRGFLQGLAERRWGAVAGVVIQAVVFTLPHLALLTVSAALAPLVVTQAVTGVILGWVRLRTGSIAPTSLAHVIVNLASGLAMAAGIAAA
ncbi:MAG: CPBP family intramembrane glutamic endopeptidase [Propionicimonas sp.]|jgi:membrane protease YdiL (CAAX protease family)